MITILGNLCLIAFFFFNSGVDAAIFGSEISPSREGEVTCPQEDTNNQINALGAASNGIVLENVNTTCTFDSIFPVTGSVNLNGGTIYLAKDLYFDSGADIVNMGNIYGGGLRVHCADTITSLTIYSGVDAQTKLFEQVDIASFTKFIYSADWTYDDQYLVTGDSGSKLSIYSFDGSSLSYVDNIGVTQKAYSVRAHPSGYYIAVATKKNSSGNEVRIYKLTGSTLSLVDSHDLGTKHAYAVDWSCDGAYLAVGYNERINVYSFIDEDLSLLDSLDYGSDYTRRNAIAWDPTCSYIALGTSDSLRIFHFDSQGNTITSKKREQMPGGADVWGLDWSRTGSFIAIGTTESSDQLHVYHYNTSSNTLTEKTSTSAGATVYDLHWNNDVTKLLVGKKYHNAGTEFQIYDFDAGSFALTLDSQAEISSDMYAVRWSHDGSYVAYGNKAKRLAVYSYVSDQESCYVNSVVWDNVLFSFEGGMSWKMGVTIQGDCVIDGLDNKLTFEDCGCISIADGASLTFKQVDVRGLSAQRLNLLGSTSSVIFRDCIVRLTNDFVFDVGSILFEGDVLFSGLNTFVYASNQTSTITANASVIFDIDSTCKYDPPIADRDLLYMEDSSSYLCFKGSTLHSTETGLRLTNGTICVDGKTTFSCEGSSFSEAICFGNGIPENDLTVKFLSPIDVDVYGGLYYDNVG